MTTTVSSVPNTSRMGIMTKSVGTQISVQDKCALRYIVRTIVFKVTMYAQIAAFVEKALYPMRTLSLTTKKAFCCKKHFAIGLPYVVSSMRGLKKLSMCRKIRELNAKAK